MDAGRLNWFVPNWFVDVGETLERKLAAFAHYATEARAYPHPRSDRAIRAAADSSARVVAARRRSLRSRARPRAVTARHPARPTRRVPAHRLGSSSRRASRSGHPPGGKPLDLGGLSFPTLNPLREALLDDALARAPTTTAARLYTGVLDAALDIATLPPRAAGNIVIVSAQFGALRTSDRVPAYRREMDATHWRTGLASALGEAAEGRLVVDCRSATYVAAWRPARDSTATRVQLAVVEERDGERRVVSHMAKKSRGDLRATCSPPGPAPARPRSSQTP